MSEAAPKEPRHEPPAGPRPRRAWASHLGWLLVGVLVGLAIAMVAFPERRPELLRPATEHGWRGAYHPDLLFLGKPMVRTDTGIDFFWRRGKPYRGAPSPDEFSVRWDTCLELPRDTVVEVRAGADDGVRAFVDGEAVVDDWGDHGFRRRMGAVELEAGVHHVVVEYYEKAGKARVEAKLVVPGDPEQEIPLSWLRVPDGPFDEEAPCQPAGSPASR